MDNETGVLLLIIARIVAIAIGSVALYIWYKWGRKAPTNGGLSNQVILFIAHYIVYNASVLVFVPNYHEQYRWIFIGWGTGVHIQTALTFVHLGWRLFKRRKNGFT